MTAEKATEFQTRIVREALALMVIHGEDVGVAHFEEAITLIGKAWNLSAEVTADSLDFIQRERDALCRIAAEENTSHVLPETELPMNASGTETLDNVWDLFETAVQLDDRGQRRALFKLADELAECQNLLDWVEKTAAEQEMPEIAVG